MYIIEYLYVNKYLYMGFPRLCSAKESACQCRRCKRHGFDPWIGKIPWSRKWHLTPVSLPGKFYGQRSLLGYSPWGSKRVRHNWMTGCKYLYVCIYIFFLAKETCFICFFFSVISHTYIVKILHCPIFFSLNTSSFSSLFVITHNNYQY